MILSPSAGVRRKSSPPGIIRGAVPQQAASRVDRPLARRRRTPGCVEHRSPAQGACSSARPRLQRARSSRSGATRSYHAGALTYYALMSLFPLLLLAVSLLGLIGGYPSTYNAIIHHLRTVVPVNALSTVNAGLKAALKDRGTALAALLLRSLQRVLRGNGLSRGGAAGLQRRLFGASRPFVRAPQADGHRLDDRSPRAGHKHCGADVRKRAHRARSGRLGRCLGVVSGPVAAGGGDRAARILVSVSRHAGHPAGADSARSPRAPPSELRSGLVALGRVFGVPGPSLESSTPRTAPSPPWSSYCVAVADERSR